MVQRFTYFVLVSFETVLLDNLLFLPGLQMTDVSLDARISALEENGGGDLKNGLISH